MYRAASTKISTNCHPHFLFNTIYNSWKPEVICLRSFVRRYGNGSGDGTIPAAADPITNCRILFLGSDDFSIKSLDAVIKVFRKSAKISVVVSNENNLLARYVKRHKYVVGDKESGQDRCSLTLSYWDEFKAHILQNPAGTLYEFHLGVVASFGHLISSKVINQCQMGILNVHGSLLPRWRGAAPTAAAIMNGDDITGVSIMKIAPHRFDIGPILHQKEIRLDPHIRTPELTALLATTGAETLKEVLENLNKFLPIALPQDESEVTKATKLTPEMGHVRWDSMDALELYNLFRAISGRYKLRTGYQGRVVDLDDLSILAREEGEITNYSNYYKYPLLISVPPQDLNSAHFEPGDILFRDKLICVKCKCSTDDNRDRRKDWIYIRKVKINQKWMSAADFQNGWLSKVGAPKHFDSLDTNDAKISKVVKV